MYSGCDNTASPSSLSAYRGALWVLTLPTTRHQAYSGRAIRPIIRSSPTRGSTAAPRWSMNIKHRASTLRNEVSRLPASSPERLSFTVVSAMARIPPFGAVFPL